MTDTTTAEATAAEVTAEHQDDTEPRASAEVVRYDADHGTIVVPTNIPDYVLRFERGQRALTEEQMHMLAPIGIEASWDPATVAVFLIQCGRRGLDPWRRQAYLLKIDGKLVYHVGIHGLLSLAEDTQRYRGLSGPHWCGPDGMWRDVWLDPHTPPAAARVGVMAEGFDGIVYGTAMWDEFAVLKDERAADNRRTGRRIPQANWRPPAQGGKPAHMLAKCAKAIALRDAFPEKCGGLYIPEETEKSRADEGERRRSDPSAKARREAYDAAVRETAATPGAPVFAGLNLSDEQARALLLAELDEQATIGDTTRDAMTRRFREARGGVALEDVPLRDLARLVHDARPFVVKRLRDQDRPDEANLYANAPAAGTAEELFGRRAAVLDGASS